MSKLSRRNVLAGLTALWAKPSPRSFEPSRDHPDSDLLASCGDYQKWADEMSRLIDLPVGSDPGDRLLMKALDIMDVLEPGVVNTAATTLSGLRAKASIISWAREGDLSDDPDGTLQERLVSSLLRDLLQPLACEQTEIIPDGGLDYG